MLHNPPAKIADSPLLDGYNSAGCSVYEFPLPPPPGKLRHQESLVAISSRALLPTRQGNIASRSGKTLTVDWDAASDWSWDAESCISTRPGRMLRKKASNTTLLPPPQAPHSSVPSKSSRRQTMAPRPSSSSRPAAPIRTSTKAQPAALFASASMPERTLTDRTSFLQLDDDSPPIDTHPPSLVRQVPQRSDYPSAARLALSSSMPEMKGGVLSGFDDDVFPPESHGAHNFLRPNRCTMIPVDPENRCSAFDRLEASITKLRAHAPSPSPLGTQEPTVASVRPQPQAQPQKRRKPTDRHTYTPGTPCPSQPRAPDATSLRQAHKSRWRDVPIPDVPPHIGSMLRSTDISINPRSFASEASFGLRSTPTTPRHTQPPRPMPPSLLPSPALPSPRNLFLNNAGGGRPRVSQKPNPHHMQTPSVPPVLTSFMNMSPEQHPSHKDSQERSARVKKLLKKASIIGWWKKKGKGKDSS